MEKKEKRYTVNLSSFVYARNDREAMKKAACVAKHLNEFYGDSYSKVTALYETPFASLDLRLVHEGNLTLFENKLIET